MTSNFRSAIITQFDLEYILAIVAWSVANNCAHELEGEKHALYFVVAEACTPK